jgi:hypothetical protein
MRPHTIRRAIALAIALTACDSFNPAAFEAPLMPVGSVRLTVELGSSLSGLEPDKTIILRADLFRNDQSLIESSGYDVRWTNSDESIASMTKSPDGRKVTLKGRKKGTTKVSATVTEKSASFDIGVIAGTPTQIVAVSGGGQVGVVGDAFPQPFVAEVRDASGNTANPGVDVSFLDVTSTVATVATDANGRVSTTWTPSAAGSKTLTARLYTTVTASFPVSVTTITMAATTPTDASVGIAITPAPTVQLRLASDNSTYRKQGVTVTATAPGAPAGVTLSGVTATTDANGLATFSNLTVSGPLGTVPLRFTATAPAATANASVTLKAGTLAKLKLLTQPSTSAIADVALSTQPVVQITDAADNAIAQSGIVITASPAIGSSAGVTVSGATATTDVAGKATFTQLKVVGASGQSYRLQFSASSATVLATQTGTLTGTPFALLVTIPMSAQCGTTLSPVVTAQLRDNGGRNVALSDVQIGLSSSTGATPSVTNAATDLTGLATFTNLSLSGSLTNHSLQFSANGLPTVTNSVSLSAGAATKLVLVTQPPTTATNGVTFTTSPVVQLTDGCGNPVGTSAIPIVAGVSSGSAIITNGTVNTSGDGRATFSSLQMRGPVGSYTLRFTRGTLTAAVATSPTVLSVGAATELVMSTEPPTTGRHGVALSTAPVVEVRDVGGNAVPGARTVTAAISSGLGGTLLNATATTDAVTGRATFTGLTINGVKENYLLRFSSTSLTAVFARAIALGGSGTPANMIVTTAPSTGALLNQPLTTVPVVRVRDEFNVFVPASMLIQASSSLGNIKYVNANTDGSGTATFTSLQFLTTGTTTLQFAATGLPTVSAPNATHVPTTLTSGTGVPISGAAGSVVYYGIRVNGTSLSITRPGGTGTFEVYARRGDLPTTSAYDCLASQSASSCSLTAIQSGSWFIMVRAITAFSGVTLTATAP